MGFGAAPLRMAEREFLRLVPDVLCVDGGGFHGLEDRGYGLVEVREWQPPSGVAEDRNFGAGPMPPPLREWQPPSGVAEDRNHPVDGGFADHAGVAATLRGG